MYQLWMIIGLVLLMAGCDTQTATPTQSMLTMTPTQLPEIEITAVVLDGPIPSPTPACDSTPQTRMIVGERGRVTDEDTLPLNVRSQPGTDSAIEGKLNILDIFLVVVGPRCRDGYVWYLIDYEDLRGWIAEGDSLKYYIEPYLPG